MRRAAIVIAAVLVVAAGTWLVVRVLRPDSAPAVETDRIRVDAPRPGDLVESPLVVRGEARGSWYFEADFPVVLVDWDGLIIAEGFARAQDDWMTEDFVPFRAELRFESPYERGDPEFMERGTIILQRANPSGLPENDAAVEVPLRFEP
ncbi:MAG: Gmad2 immunoglobulin-like domain-containing protein [Spirochaetota bacterium]